LVNWELVIVLDFEDEPAGAKNDRLRDR